MITKYLRQTIFSLLITFAAQTHAATFNAKDYGAVADDKTDNTAAFSKCVEAVIPAGGGKMYLPGRSLSRPDRHSPARRAASWITLEIVGESEPAPVWGTIGIFLPPTAAQSSRVSKHRVTR